MIDVSRSAECWRRGRESTPRRQLTAASGFEVRKAHQSLSASKQTFTLLLVNSNDVLYIGLYPEFPSIYSFHLVKLRLA